MAKKLFLTLFLATFISACTTTQGESSSNSSSNSSSGTLNAEVNLSEAATSVSNSLAELAAIEKANSPKTKLPPPPNPATIGMADIASVDWGGPIEPLVKRLADASNYKLRVIGKEPATPIIVSVNAENETIADILRDVSFQAEKRTDILIYPSRKIIELRYLQ